MFAGSGDASSSFTTRKDQLSCRIHQALKPYESPILSFQRLLVWDNPMYSTLFVFLLHLGLWYVWANSDHAFGFIFSFILILLLVDLWKRKLWPEVRAVPPDNDLEWGELNPGLLCLKEMSDILASVYLFLEVSRQEILIVRANHRGKFCMICSALCVVMMFIGQHIPGAFFCYMVILNLLVWPVLWYHRFLDKAYSFMEPYFMQMQYMLQQRPSDTYQIAKSMASQKSFEKKDDSDEDLSEFLPDLDGKTAALLAKAISDDSELSEQEEEVLAQGVPAFFRANTPDPVQYDEHHVSSISHELKKLTEQSDHEDDNFGIPLAYSGTSGTQLASLLQNLPLNSDVIGSAVSNIVKDTFSSVAKSMQSSNAQTDGPPGSATSTPSSEYEFIDFVTDEEDN